MQHSIPILASTHSLTARRVFCVGRNYADHAREMGADPNREAPFFFYKPTDALVIAPDLTRPIAVPYPPMTQNLHYEVEMVIALGKGGADIAVEQAMDCVLGFALGLDLTRRDLQNAAKALGQPWDMAKGFDHSAPISPILPLTAAGDFGAWDIALSLDGVIKQQGSIRQMIWSVPEIIAQLSRYVRLATGDLIFTGTPAGVGPMERGQTMAARLGPDLRLALVVEG
jgi:fumarylpyruvate hydrolase